MLNWKAINKTCPKAFLEWVNRGLHIETKYVTSSSLYVSGLRYALPIGVVGLPIDEVDLLKLPYYFDGLGIVINPSFMFVYWNLGFFCKADNFRPVYLLEDESVKSPLDFQGKDKMACFPDRLSALKEGIKKAFEIREQQLND